MSEEIKRRLVELGVGNKTEISGEVSIANKEIDEMGVVTVD